MSIASTVVPYFPTLGEGLCSVVFPTASPYSFRAPSELDRYLEASQIRERAIERINSVTGTYALVFIINIISLSGVWLLVYNFVDCYVLICMINH